jgi:hypothetical protein
MHLPLGQKIAVIALFGFGTLYVPLGEVVISQANLHKCLCIHNFGDSRCLQVRRQFERGGPQDGQTWSSSLRRVQPCQCFGYCSSYQDE